MAMRFDQIGSQQNVQNVGEGEAYVYEKQKSPLLALGEQAMKTKLAEDKAKAKAAAGGAAKIDLLKVESPSLSYVTAFNKALNQVSTTVNKKGDPNTVNNANTKVQQLSNLAVVSKQYTTDFSKTDDLATNLFKTDDASSRVYNKKASEIKSNADKLTESNPNDYYQGISESLGYLSQNNPNNVLNSAMKHSDASIDKMATGIASNLKTQEVGLSTSSNLTTEKLRNIKDKAIGDINVLVDKEGKSTATINTYMDKFYENQNAELNNPKNSAFLSTKQTEGSELVGKNDKGEDIYIDPKEYSKAKFKEDLISKIDRSNVLTTKIIKDYGFGGVSGGAAGQKGALLTPGTIKVGVTDATRHAHIYEQMPLINFTAAKPSQQLLKVQGRGSGTVLVQPGDNNKYGPEQLNPGDDLFVNGISFTLTNKSGSSQIYSGINVFDANGKLDIEATANNIKAKMDNGYEFGDKIGVLISATKLDKASVQAVSSADQASEDQKSSQTQKALEDSMSKNKASGLLISATGKDANVGRTAFGQIVGHNDIQKFVKESDDDNGRSLQKAFDLAKKRSTKTAGGSGGASGATTNTGAMSGFNQPESPSTKKIKEGMSSFNNSGAAKGSFNDKYKGNHMTYVDVAKTHTGSLDDLIPKIADWEDKNKVGKGGGDYWGTNDAKYNTKEKAVAHYKEKYLPQVSNLPKGVQSLGLQQVINTGDAWGPAMTAAGLYSEKGEGGKLGIRGDNRREGKVEKISIRQKDLYNANIKAITDSYNKDPKAFRERYLKAMKYHYDNAF